MAHSPADHQGLLPTDNSHIEIDIPSNGAGHISANNKTATFFSGPQPEPATPAKLFGCF